MVKITTPYDEEIKNTQKRVNYLLKEHKNLRMYGSAVDTLDILYEKREVWLEGFKAAKVVK